MKKKVYFRADASRAIGYGHFIRSLALADMLKDDFDCRFFTTAPTPYQEREAEGVCHLIALNGDFLDYLHGDEIVVLDNYFFSTQYQQAIKDKGCKLVFIDDLHDKHFVADVVISQCLDDVTLYSDVESYTTLCLGPRWTMLRRPFIEKLPVLREKGHCLICYGGSDPDNHTLKAVEDAIERGFSRISVIIGDAYAFEGSLPSSDKLTVYRKLDAVTMARMMQSAEYVMCSASTTAYEALSCGCKVETSLTAENQKDFYQLLHRGELKIDPAASKASFIKLFKALELDILNYTELSTKQSYELWEKRNRKDIRCWMSDPAPFSFESHSSFVSRLAESDDKLFFAAFKDGIFVGSYSFKDIGNGYADRGLFLNPEYQGHGYAAALEAYFDGIIKRRGVNTLKAEVLLDNQRSLSYHLKNGWEEIGKESRYHYLEKKI